MIRSKFFKIMMPGFEETLKLPPAFCEKVKNEKSKMAILESCKGRWKITACREDDDDQIIILEDGWPRFAEEHGLSLRDFLVFEHTGKLHFNVTVYDMSACQKQYLVESDNQHQTINPIYHSKKKTPLGLGSQSQCFSYKLSHYAATSKIGKVTVPVEFARQNNLVEKTGAVLKDGRRGREWRVKISVQNWPRLMVMMSSGWRDFVVDNNLEVGDLCTFQLNPNIKSSTSKNVSFHVLISRNTKR